MAVSALSAGKTLCELRDWTLSNLEAQKILYIAHMFQLGRVGRPLVNEAFEAWDYGPVVPDLYRRAKGFGSEPVRNVFHWIDAVSPGSEEYRSLQDVANATRSFTPGKLVSVTHWDQGAWARYYRPGIRGIVIPNEAIRKEYRDRFGSQSANS